VPQIGAVAGVVVAPLNFVSYDEGLVIGIKGFIAAVLGGLRKLSGCGGRRASAWALWNRWSAAFISSQFKDAIAFVTLLSCFCSGPAACGQPAMSATLSRPYLLLDCWRSRSSRPYRSARNYLLSALVLAAIYAIVITGLYC